MRASRVTTWLVVFVVTAASSAQAIGLAEERELGARFALEARVQIPLLRAPTVSGYLRAVGGSLVARLDAQPFTYRFFVVRDQNLNAFAVPGGYVYVHTGLLLSVESEAELAGVLAHELVHVAAHHAVRQQEKTSLVNYGTLLGVFLSVLHPALGAGAVAASSGVQASPRGCLSPASLRCGTPLRSRGGSAAVASLLPPLWKRARARPISEVGLAVLGAGSAFAACGIPGTCRAARRCA